jgi:hypothetical protein
MNVNSTIPSVLVQNAAMNENQDTQLTTVRLEPNTATQVGAAFVLPKSGSVLDSNSSLVWSIAWDGYDNANIANEMVCLKQFSGGLNTIRRARFYVGGRLLFTNPDVGLTAHIHKLSTNPDHYEQVEDVKLGSQHGYYASSNGQVKAGEDASNQNLPDKRVKRQLGSYSIVPSSNYSWECTVLLSDIFPALKHLQMPIKFLKDDVRVEVDWETSFDEVATVIKQSAGMGALTISINNPLLFLDYLTYNEEVEMGLMAASQQGITLPYREMSLITQQISGADAGVVADRNVFLGFQGKLLMKVYVSHRFADVINGVTISPMLLNGRCRCDRGQNFKYNLIVNDLHIHDSKVDTSSQTYSYMSMTAENPVYTFPNTYDFNLAAGTAPAATDINFGGMTVSGQANNTANGGLSDTQAKDGIAGTQAWIGFDLSRYGVGGGLDPSNSGYRVGSTPVVLNIEQLGGGANTRQSSVKQVDVIAESIKVLQIRNGTVDTVDA